MAAENPDPQLITRSTLPRSRANLGTHRQNHSDVLSPGNDHHLSTPSRCKDFIVTEVNEAG